MEFINLTPHTIKIKKEDGILEIPASGKVARVSVSQEKINEFDGIPVFRQKYGEVQNLPAPKDNTIYIVSSLVLTVVKRNDVVAPDTGATAIRNEQGNIIAVIGFITS